MLTDNLNINLAAASTLSGASPASIQNWIKGNKIVGQRVIEGGGAKGKHRLFRFTSVMEIAIASSLIETGMKSVDRAFRAAHIFAHTDDGEVGGRQIAYPYHHEVGETFIFVSADSVSILCDGRDAITQPKIFESLNFPVGYVALNATDIFRAVVGRMGVNHHPHKFLDAAYPEEVTA